MSGAFAPTLRNVWGVLYYLFIVSFMYGIAMEVSQLLLGALIGIMYLPWIMDVDD
jgi:hypothetical protein